MWSDFPAGLTEHLACATAVLAEALLYFVCSLHLEQQLEMLLVLAQAKVAPA